MTKTDIEIAREIKLKKITEIAKSLGLKEDEYELYGNYKAKINFKDIKPKGKLILVTAINPTSLGEGKTTISIGLADGLKYIGKNVCLALREPSLGPVFGIKGGATGGGYAQVAPMEDINLHFTGDIHAITCANNLLAAAIDNHIHNGNKLNIDIRRIIWRRCVDLNDRALRSIICSLGGVANGYPREEGFDITAASEIMAILCLSKDLMDLKNRLSKIIVAYTPDLKPVTCGDLIMQDALTIVLKDAIKPNLVQTLEGTPALIHGGPFANIAHGCNSVIATKTALSLADYVVTEAGFGADLGAEKFIDIKCRLNDLHPQCIVLVATIRALKLNGGLDKTALTVENLDALTRGLVNLGGHIENITKHYKLPCVVAINTFLTDTDKEINIVKDYCISLGAKCKTVEAWAYGGKGAEGLAREVIDIVDNNYTETSFTYDVNDSIKKKIETVAKKIYGAGRVEFLDKANKEIQNIEKLGLSNLPVCIAKTQYSFSDNQKLLGRPKDYTFTIRDIKLRAGAGFIVAISGDIMLMPGLPETPNACKMTIDSNGNINGLF